MQTDSKNVDSSPAADRVLLLVGHGSEHDDRSSRPVRRHARRLADHPDFDRVETAFWKEPPSIEGALERIEADEIVVLPVFTSHGYYAGRVVPEALGLDSGVAGEVVEAEGSRVVYTEAFGTHPDVTPIARASIEEILEEADCDPERVSIVVAGHGTPKDDRSSQTTELLADRLRESEPYGEVRVGFMDESPRIDCAVTDAEHETVIVVPFFVADGGHAAEDIPGLLDASSRDDFPGSFLGHEVHYAPSVGTDSEIAAILGDRASEAADFLDSSPDSHGTNGGEWSLRRLMSEVGSGPRTSADMTRSQAGEAFERMLDRRPAPETLGAFLVANRWKSNTPEELAAFVDAMNRRRVGPGDGPDVDGPLVDCGANYDGKTSTLLLGVAAGLVSAELGAPVAVHGADRVPMSEGDAYLHVLRELGVGLPESVEESHAMTESYGFGFYDQRQFLPDLAELVEQRRRIGVRTLFNTVETLANPAGARIHLGSFYHLVYATKTIDTFREARTSNFERTVMVQGLEGYDDVRPGSTKVVVWDEGREVDDFEVETDGYGFDFDRSDLERSEIAEVSARATEEVLLDERRDTVFDAVCLNAGVRAFAAEAVDSIREGIQAARSAIEEGGAGERLADLRR